jgi:pSer/pThr/pTyr-binding forkhead associated (FHA) protein
MAVNCNVCGTDIEENSSVCDKCGNSVGEATTVSFTIHKEDDTKHEIFVHPKEYAQLVVVKGPNIGDSYLIDDDEIAIGRDPLSDIFLDDVTVSRKHAVINVKDSEFILKDAGSLNGTYVNGVRLDQVVLNHGDQLQVGKYKLLFVGGK